MKPTIITSKDAQKLPFLDFQYQPSRLQDVTGHCAITTSKSLHDISRDYFDNEANRDFLSDAAVFGTLIATAGVPIVIGLNAVVELCRALPLY